MGKSLIPNLAIGYGASVKKMVEDQDHLHLQERVRITSVFPPECFCFFNTVTFITCKFSLFLSLASIRNLQWCIACT